MNTNIAGIDIGGTMMKGALFDSRGHLLNKEKIPTHPEHGEDAFIANIVSFVKKLQLEHSAAASLGIGIAGVIDKKRETLLESPNLPLFKNFTLKKLLETKLHIPVFLENDANCAALGELWAGEGKGLDSFLLLTLGTGIGSGLILNGQLLTGEVGKAGECGHIVVNPDGARCACGKTGCLEAHSSGTAIVRMARSALESGETTVLSSYYPARVSELTPKIIFDEALKGDRLCRQIYFDAARFLAIGISNINNILDIHHFIIGGGVSKAFHLFEETLLSEVKKNVFEISRNAISIVISKLGNDAGVYGAGYLAAQNNDRQVTVSQ